MRATANLFRTIMFINFFFFKREFIKIIKRFEYKKYPIQIQNLYVKPKPKKGKKRWQHLIRLPLHKQPITNYCHACTLSALYMFDWIIQSMHMFWDMLDLNIKSGYLLYNHSHSAELIINIFNFHLHKPTDYSLLS